MEGRNESLILLHVDPLLLQLRRKEDTTTLQPRKCNDGVHARILSNQITCRQKSTRLLTIDTKLNTVAALSVVASVNVRIEINALPRLTIWLVVRMERRR
eukprot:532151-Hanusia_phi.AAC.3